MLLKLEDLTKEQAVALLKKITEALDYLDSEDFFGTEGWRRYLGIKI